MANAPSPFSPIVPNLRLVLSSSSLGDFKTCPYKYNKRVNEGWTTKAESIHLLFGKLLHSSIEYYHFSRALNQSHEDALDQAFQYALTSTWDSERGRPMEMNDGAKNRISLLRALVWYLDQWGPAGDPLKTVYLSNGKPAVELPFEFDSGYQTPDGEAISFMGFIDRIVELNGELYITDIKTTGSQLSAKFFSQFNPDNQVYLYLLAGQIIMSKPISGIIIDGLQIGAGFIRNQRQMIQIPTKALTEWYEELEDWLYSMYRCARQSRWPKNDKSCGMYGGCEYRNICGRSPEARSEWLEADFTKEMWNPLEKRGDI